MAYSEPEETTSNGTMRDAKLPMSSKSGIREVQEETLEEDLLEPVAVIGFSLKFPQDATSVESFWQMIVDGQSASVDIPKDRFNAESFYDENPNRTGTMNVKKAHFLKDDIAAFDAPFFSITPAEAACMDPQQRWLLETAYRALENAGIPLEKAAGSNTSVYIGSFTNDYSLQLQKDTKTQAKYFATGTEPGMLANRLSWFFDLRGPSMQIDTACSSSLNALHLACQGLRCRDSYTGLIGGCNLFFNPEGMFAMTDLNFLSPDGISYSFDERANGYSRGEGFGVVVVKLLSSALRDGDTIRAIIRSTGSNQDGRTPGITQPSAEAQAALVRDTYHSAGLSLRLTRFFEAHGTGTLIGDPIEASAINSVFGEYRSHENPLIVGALKSNIGHLEGASGVASLIKTILVLEKGIIPKNLWFECVNSRIPLGEWNIKFPTQTLPWPTNGIRRASINSFGFGGSNAHAVLDDVYNYLRLRGISGKHCTVSCPPISPHQDVGASNGLNDVYVSSCDSTHIVPEDIRPVLLVFSTSDELGLNRLAPTYQNYLLRRSSVVSDYQFLQNLAYTLAEKRSLLPWKSYMVASSVSEMRTNWESLLSQPTRSSGSLDLGFVFTGQGAHWSAMGKDLLRYPIFEKSLLGANKYFHKLGCTWSLIDELLKDDTISSLCDPAFSQPICTALQIAIVNLLRTWNIKPAVVVGHSSGEIAAAYCSGDITEEAAWKIAYYRGSVTSRLRYFRQEAETMMSVGLSEADIQPYLDENANSSNLDALSIGCVNSPRNVTVSGNKARILVLQQRLLQKEIFARLLNVDTAYHSRSMQKVASDYLVLLEGVCANSANVRTSTMVSSVTGKEVSTDELGNGEYWVRNLTCPVRFLDACRKLCAHSSDQNCEELGLKTPKTAVDHIVEIGPQSALRTPIKDILASEGKSKRISYNSVLTKGVSAIQSALIVAGRLHCVGSPVNFAEINDPRRVEHAQMLSDLPEYPFNHSQSYWIESRQSQNFRFRDHSEHELLGATVPDWNPLDARWRNVIKLAENEWMVDHKVHGNVLLPAAGMIMMTIEAVKLLADPAEEILGYRVQNVSFNKPAMLSSDELGTEIQLRLGPHPDISTSIKSSMWREFQLYVFADEDWSECCHGTVVIEYREKSVQLEKGFGQEEDRDYHAKHHQQDIARCGTPMRSNKLYEQLKNIGLEYGQTFQVLKEVTVNDEDNEVTATISPCNWEIGATRGYARQYILHPTALDGIFQLIFPALADAKTFSVSAMLPVWVDSVWINASGVTSDASKSEIRVHAKGGFQGYREAEFSMTGDDVQTGSPAIVVDGFRAISSADSIEIMSDRAPKRLCYNIDWKPEFKTLNNQEINAYCGVSVRHPIAPTSGIIRDLAAGVFVARALKIGVQEDELVSKPHLRKYLKWMRSTSVKLGPDTLSFGDIVWTDLLHDPERQNEIIEKIEQSSSPQDQLIIKVGTRVLDILNGKLDALEYLFNDNLLERYYAASMHERIASKLATYLDVFAHKNPGLKVLEVGAGTGGMTKSILHTFVHHGEMELGTARYTNYTFTDISSSFFRKARDLFNGHEHRAIFKIFDIEQDPLEQGYEIASYDFIFAGNVLHASKSLANTLRNVRKLLKPDGKLVIFEHTNPERPRTTFVFGLLPGWWLHTEGFRRHGPLIPPERWHIVLGSNGFSGVDIHWPDHPDERYRDCSVMIATALEKKDQGHDLPVGITIATDDDLAQQQIALDLQTSFAKMGTMDCHVAPFQHIQPHTLDNRHCIVLAEMNEPLISNIREMFFSHLQKLIDSTSTVIWVTGGQDHVAEDPAASIITGLARTIKSETYEGKFVTLALESGRHVRWIVDQISKVYMSTARAPLDMYEPEYREIDGVLHINRIVEANYLCQDVFSKTTPQEPLLQPLAQKMALSIKSPGLLDTLYFVGDTPDCAELGADEVEVEVKASGLVFRDVLIALGLYDDTCFGLEFAGFVTNARPEALLNVGDRVCGWTHGSFKTQTRCKASIVRRIPDEMSFTEAATFPVSHCTAYHCLVNIARMKERESILIHSGAGGTGQAAIQMAKHFDAHIFVTVGNAEKKKLLMELYDIPEDHIFSSRTLSFKNNIKRMTGGRGVDIVLNSLSDEALRASLKCVAPFGRFIELGRKNHGNLSMAAFSSNVIFATVDLSFMLLHNPTQLGDLMQATMRLIAEKTFVVCRPLNIYGVSRIEEAFRYMQSGKNVGKTVVEMNKEDMVWATNPELPTYQFDSKATYLIAGGLGGVGRSIARWMTSRNARNLILLSRSTNHSAAAQELISDLRKKGVSIATPPCDVADKETLAYILHVCSQTLPPIKGCIQSCLALSDKPFQSMTHSAFLTAIRPKVHGSWNLHSLLPQGLDFFILLSSVAGIVGSRSQANYACGNVFQDALARHRVSLGQKAVSIDVGLMRSVGFVAERGDVARGLEQQGYMSLEEKELHAILDYHCDPALPVLSQLKSQVVTGLHTPHALQAKGLEESYWLERPLFRHLRQIGVDDAAATAAHDNADKKPTAESAVNFKPLLASAHSIHEAGEIVCDALVAKFSKSLAVPQHDIDPSKPAFLHGADSLNAIEIRRWLDREMGSEVPVFTILGNRSIRELSLEVAGGSRYVKELLKRGMKEMQE